MRPISEIARNTKTVTIIGLTLWPFTVRRRVREVLSIMAPGGGYVAGASHDFILEETPVENVVAMFDTVEEFGRYPITTSS